MSTVTKNGVTKNGVTESCTYASRGYPGGSRIKEVAGTKTTRTFFPFYVEEKVGSTTTVVKYYTFNGLTIAMRRGSDLRYLHTDHLGSNSVVTNADGTFHSGQNYCAYGGQRIATWYGYECDPTAVNPLPTDRTYTGQEQDGTGLMYYRARFYDSALGTFISPDTMVPDPGRAGDFNRFAYTRNNPLKFSDPTGHRPDDGCETEGCTLPNGLAPDAAWLLTNGAYAHVDPQIVAAEDYNPITEALLPGTAMLVGGITGGIVAGDLFLAGASLLSGWFGTAASLACADGDCTNEGSAAAQRAQNLLTGQSAYNVSPESLFNKYSTIGRNATYVTDEQAIAEVIGKFGNNSNPISVTAAQAAKLEQALGLDLGSLANGFRISRIENILARNPASPIVGNSFFLGPGKGLPGGGPELIISPISTTGGPGIMQIIVQVLGGK